MKKYGKDLDFDILVKMDELYFVVKEAFRMYSFFIMFFCMV